MEPERPHQASSSGTVPLPRGAASDGCLAGVWGTIVAAADGWWRGQRPAGAAAVKACRGSAGRVEAADYSDAGNTIRVVIRPYSAADGPTRGWLRGGADEGRPPNQPPPPAGGRHDDGAGVMAFWDEEDPDDMPVDRQKPMGGVVMATANATEWAPLTDLLTDSIASGLDLVLCQETHLVQAAVDEGAKWLAAAGWAALLSPAKPTGVRGNGRVCSSGGVGILTRGVNGLERLPQIISLDADEFASRFVIARWLRAQSFPLAVASVYGFSGEGVSDRFIDFLAHIARCVRDCGMPFILGGDWNLTAGELQRTGFVDEVGGVILAPPRDCGVSCVAGRGRTLDFFVVAKTLAPWTGRCRILDQARTRPHFPVSLHLHVSSTAPRALQLVGPRRFPCGIPTGPKRSTPCWHNAEAAVTSWEAHPSSAECAEAAFAAFSKASEAEIASVYDLVGDAAQGFLGRQPAPRFAPAKPPQPRLAPHAKCSAVARALRWWASTLARRDALLRDPCPYARGRGARLSVMLRSWRPDARWTCTAGTAALWPLLKACAKRHPTRQPLSSAQAAHWAGVLEAAATAEEGEFRRHKSHGWRMWARAAVDGGGRPAHAWVRRADASIIPPSKIPWHERPNAALATWRKVWGHRESHVEDIRGISALPLEAITARQIRAAAASFPWRTGVGADAFHPKHYAMLDDVGCDILARLLTLAERSALLPSTPTVLVSIPKASGGDRLIGLLPAWMRLYGRIRRPLAKEWELRHRRGYFWDVAGRSACDSTFVQALLAEAAAARGDAVCSLALDVHKCFERIDHTALVQAAERHRFPLAVVRLCLLIYAGPRRIRVDEAFSDEFNLGIGVIAGCSVATALLRLVTLLAADIVAQRFHDVELYIYVDDTDMQAVGSAAKAAKRLAAAGAAYGQAIEQYAGLALNEGKCVATASCRRSRILLRAAFRGTKVRVLRAYRKLGVGFALAGNRPTLAVAPRIASLTRRRTRVAALRKAASRSAALAIFRRGAYAAATYGVPVLGLADGELRELRRTGAAAVAPASRFGCRTIALELYGDDAAGLAEAVTAPLIAWAKAAWSGTINLVHLQQAWGRAAQRAEGRRPAAMWRAALGPAGAVAASLPRIGWTARSATLWCTQSGEAVDLQRMCPRSVASLVAEAYRGAEWARAMRKIGAPDSLLSIPCLEPLRRAARPRNAADGPALQAAATIAGIAGAAPTQAILADLGIAESDLCWACGEERGDYVHRLWRCPAYAPERRQAPGGRLSAFAGPGAPEDIYWLLGRALLADPRRRAEPPRADDGAVWQSASGAPLFEDGATICTDGSAARPADKLLRRAGWAAASVRDDGTICAVLAGALPGHEQSVFKAELYALWAALARVQLRAHFVIDSAAVLAGISRGQEWCVRANGVHADLWKAVWLRIGDIGLANLRFSKVKAHVPLCGRAAFDHPPSWFRGNAEADRYAKWAVTLHPDVEPYAQRYASAVQLVTTVARWIGSLGARVLSGELPADVQPRQPRGDLGISGREQRATRSVSREALGRAVRRGDILEPVAARGGRWRCRVCGIISKRRVWLRRHACAGALQSAVKAHPSHTLWRLQDFTFCIECGAYGAQRTYKLATVCHGRALAGTVAAKSRRRLTRGRHPVSGIPLGVPRRLRGACSRWECGRARAASEIGEAARPPPRRRRLEGQTTGGAAALEPSDDTCAANTGEQVPDASLARNASAQAATGEDSLGTMPPPPVGRSLAATSQASNSSAAAPRRGSPSRGRPATSNGQASEPRATQREKRSGKRPREGDGCGRRLAAPADRLLPYSWRPRGWANEARGPPPTFASSDESFSVPACVDSDAVCLATASAPSTPGATCGAFWPSPPHTVPYPPSPGADGGPSPALAAPADDSPRATPSPPRCSLSGVGKAAATAMSASGRAHPAPRGSVLRALERGASGLPANASAKAPGSELEPRQPAQSAAERPPMRRMRAKQPPPTTAGPPLASQATPHGPRCPTSDAPALAPTEEAGAPPADEEQPPSPTLGKYETCTIQSSTSVAEGDAVAEALDEEASRAALPGAGDHSRAAAAGSDEPCLGRHAKRGNARRRRRSRDPGAPTSRCRRRRAETGGDVEQSAAAGPSRGQAAAALEQASLASARAAGVPHLWSRPVRHGSATGAPPAGGSLPSASTQGDGGTQTTRRWRACSLGPPGTARLLRRRLPRGDGAGGDGPSPRGGFGWHPPAPPRGRSPPAPTRADNRCEHSCRGSRRRRKRRAASDEVSEGRHRHRRRHRTRGRRNGRSGSSERCSRHTASGLADGSVRPVAAADSAAPAPREVHGGRGVRLTERGHGGRTDDPGRGGRRRRNRGGTEISHSPPRRRRRRR